jgi:hypothetical protein
VDIGSRTLKEFLEAERRRAEWAYERATREQVDERDPERREEER